MTVSPPEEIQQRWLPQTELWLRRLRSLEGEVSQDIMMEEHQTSTPLGKKRLYHIDEDVTNTVIWPTVCNKDGEEDINALCNKEDSMSVDGHCTDPKLYTSPRMEGEPHQPHTLDYLTVSITEEPDSFVEKKLPPEDLTSPKESLPSMDKSPPTTSNYVMEELSEDDGIITVLIKEVPHLHDGSNIKILNHDSVTDHHPSVTQPNSTILQNEIEVVYQNPPNDTFGDIANLTRYSRTHSKRKTLQCPVCGKYFLRTAHLVAHEVTHPEKCSVNCSKCGQVFPSTADLLAHKRTHRPETLFLCLECGRCYRCRGQLVLHQRRHLREKTLESM